MRADNGGGDRTGSLRGNNGTARTASGTSKMDKVGRH